MSRKVVKKTNKRVYHSKKRDRQPEDKTYSVRVKKDIDQHIIDIERFLRDNGLPKSAISESNLIRAAIIFLADQASQNNTDDKKGDFMDDLMSLTSQEFKSR